MSKLIRNLVLAAGVAGLVTATALGPADAQQKDKSGGAVEVYKDRGGDYRWRVKDADGKVIAMPPKGYDTKDECLKALAQVKATLAKAQVTEVKGEGDAKKGK